MQPDLHPLVVCGGGRLGTRIANALRDLGLSPASARLDPAQGVCANGQPLRGRIVTLLICISPRDVAEPDRNAWWQALFLAVRNERDAGELAIERLYFVSSTVVYDGIARGFIDAETPSRPASPRAEAMVAAEASARQCAAYSCMLRCAGLYGSEYLRYDPKTFSQDRLRHGVDVDDAATRIARVMQEEIPPAVVLLTDGRVYFQGQEYAAGRNEPAASRLAENGAVMLAGKSRNDSRNY